MSLVGVFERTPLTFFWGISASLLLHLLGLMLLAHGPHLASRSPILVSYPVSLVSLKLPELLEEGPQALPAPPVSERQAAPPAIKTFSPPRETAFSPPSSPLKSDLPDLSPVEATQEEQPVLQNQAVSPVVPPSSLPIESKVPPGGVQTASVQAVSVNEGGGGGGSYDGPLLNYPYYFEGIQRKISAFWVVPADLSLSHEEEIRVVIGFVVQKNGRLKEKSVTLEKSSGNSFWDSSALRAVYNADPLLPLPRGITDEIHIHFEFKLLRS